MRIRHTITFSSAKGVPEGSEDGPYGSYGFATRSTRTPSAYRLRPLVSVDAQAVVSQPANRQFVRTADMPQPLPETEDDSLPAADQPPGGPASEEVVDAIARVIPKNDWKPVALVSFLGFLVVAPGSSVLVRLVAAGFGANALWGEGGLLKKA